MKWCCKPERRVNSECIRKESSRRIMFRGWGGEGTVFDHIWKVRFRLRAIFTIPLENLSRFRDKYIEN